MPLERTMKREVIDSLNHRFSSRRWPITMQAQRRATNNVMASTLTSSASVKNEPILAIVL